MIALEPMRVAGTAASLPQVSDATLRRQCRSTLSPHEQDCIARRFVRALAGVGCVAGAILMIELALTRIFSVTMYYHFAFLAISIALFGLSASGVYVYVARHAFEPALDRQRC